MQVAFADRRNRGGQGAVSLAALALCLIACFAFASTHAVPADAATYDSSQVSWQVKGGKVYAKTKGKKLKGLQTIGSKTYYFDKKGVQHTGWHKVKGSYRYFTIANKAKGSMVVSRVICGVKLKKNGTAKLTSAAKAELNILMKANKLMDKLAKPAWSKQKKLRAAWKYMTNRRKVKERSYRNFHNKKNWHHAFALDVFNKRSGSCWSMGAALAYLAQASGFKSCKAVSSGGHGWALIDGLVYDPEWTTGHKGDWYAIKGSFHGVNYAANSSYVATICPNANAAAGSATHKKKVSKRKNGLVKSGKSYCFYAKGKKLKSKWKTVKGKRYYFKRNGKAATCSCKVKGTWYVFDKKGRLFKGKKTRLVKVGSQTYRVSKSGKAVKGWNVSKTKRFAKTGQLMCGVWVVSGKLYAASSSGVYDVARTAQLQAAAVVNQSPAELLALLGAPKKKTYADSCQTGPSGLSGKDGIFEYAHVTVITFLDTAGSEFLMGVEAM